MNDVVTWSSSVKDVVTWRASVSNVVTWSASVRDVEVFLFDCIFVTGSSLYYVVNCLCDGDDVTMVMPVCCVLLV